MSNQVGVEANVVEVEENSWPGVEVGCDTSTSLAGERRRQEQLYI